jgi:broad specificity phosphatase PhoE
MKGFEDILDREKAAGDGKRDLVIVSHSGVINVILSNLSHMELEDGIKNRIPNGGVVAIDFTNIKEKQL